MTATALNSLSLGTYNEHDHCVHITGGAMSGPQHIHIAVYGDKEHAERIAREILKGHNGMAAN